MYQGNKNHFSNKYLLLSFIKNMLSNKNYRDLKYNIIFIIF